MNKVIMTGNVARDPEVRYTTDGLAVANYSLAVDRGSKDKKTDFFNCTAFGKGAEFVGKYLRKGLKVLIEGTLQTEEWTTKEGQKRTGTKIVVISHEFCEKKSDREQVPQVPAPTTEFMEIPEGNEELPFSF